MELSKRMKMLLVLVFLIFQDRGSLFSQTQVVTDSPFIAGTTVVIPGKHFNRSSFHEMWWGKHYREEWNTPIRVRNFSLDTAFGGLTPLKESGGRQTRGLRLKIDKGHEYVLRSVDKNFAKGLPDVFQGTVVAKIAKDQGSIGHPYASIIVAPMIRATGIYHTNPQLVFVQKQKALGAFNDEYGDQLYMIEERPDENWEEAANFGSSKNIIGTERLFEKVYGDNDNHVDQIAFAKARLFDMFIGDWSRHDDQWRWAEFKNGKNLYRPIPRDRDQAFTTFDGFFPWFASSVVGAKSLESFDHDLSNVKDFNEPARVLDKKFLNEVPREDWIRVANELKQSLTDEVIEDAVRQMPDQAFAISGENIISKLKSRRDELQQYAEDYYEYLAQRVDLTGSEKREYFEIKRYNKDSTGIRIFRINKDNEIEGQPFYNRIFRKTETKEIRLYGLANADSFHVINPKNDGVLIRIIDPGENDHLSISKDRRTKAYSGHRYEYDTLHQQKLDFFFLPFLSPPETDIFDEDPMGLFTRTGLKVGANVRLHPQPWQKEEYENWHLVTANYGFLRSTFYLAYIGTFRKFAGNWDMSLAARMDAPASENFYGIGNETYNSKFPSNYYDTKSSRLFGSAGLSRQIGKYHRAGFNLFYQRVKIKYQDEPFQANPVGENVFQAQQFAGGSVTYAFNSLNRKLLPTKGINFLASGGYIMNLTVSDRAFWKGSSSLSVYLPLSKSFTLALRAGGGMIEGDADYFHMHTLGGNENLRGYQRERFFANNVFYNNNELRWVVNTRNFLFNGRIGLLAFQDNGRAWHPGEKSGTWHMGYGGGLILVPFEKIALVGTYGLSEEGHDILLRASLFF